MLSRGFLVATAAVFVSFGIWGLVLPGQMLSRFGIALSDPAGKTAIRAMYAGFLIGAGLLFGFDALGDGARVRCGLQSVLILSGAILTARILGMVVDRSATPFHLSYAALEIAA
jgi:hypothetical protein